MAQFEEKLERRRLTFQGKPSEWPRFRRQFEAVMDELELTDAMETKYAPSGAIIPGGPGDEEQVEPVAHRTRRATMLRELEQEPDWADLDAQQKAAARARVRKEETEAADEDRKRANRRLYNQLVAICVGEAYNKLNGVPRYDGFEAWRALKRAYQNPTELRLTTLQQQLMIRTIGDKDDPEAYFAAVADTLTELEENNILIDENQMKRIMLANLGGKYMKVKDLFMYGLHGPEGYSLAQLK